MVGLDHVEHVEVGVGDEFSWRVCERQSILLQLLAEFRDSEDPAFFQHLLRPACVYSSTHLKVFPEMPMRPSGHIAALRVQAYSSVS
jgi:hypothetical protein